VRVAFRTHTMPEIPHLPPTQRSGAASSALPSRERSGGPMQNRYLRGASQTSEAAWRRDHLGKLLAAIWIVAVAVRLIFINQPYVDHWSWRQSDVAAIARNFYDGGFRFAYPQIDWAGDATGYVGTEFPILPFVAAICYKFVGIHEWIGRGQAVIFFAVSLPFFFLLVREIFGSTAAVWATVFFSFAPLNIFAGRSFMPDVPSLSLAIIGLYFFLRWTHDQKWTPLLLAAIAFSLSSLIKITSAVIFAPLAYLAVAGIADPGLTRGLLGVGRDHRSRLQLLLFIAITVVPSAAWYWHAYQIAERFYPHHFFGAGGVRIESLEWYWNIARQTATSSLTPVLAIMALIGLSVALGSRTRSVSGRAALQARYSLLFHWWLAGMILFIIIVGYGNRHRWYQLPLVPITAAFAGAACSFFASKTFSRRVAIALSILLASSFAILSYVYVRPLYESSAAQLRDAGLALNKITPSDALIVAADMGDPTIFYYSQRKGWHFLEEDGIYQGTPSDSQDAIIDLEKLRRRGATHVVFTRNTLWWLDYYPELAQRLAESATVMAASKEFKIYKFDATAR
jgi:4-amino-4-deoxy-L-arabinose transferase-like glycosyltransferase